MTLTDIYFLLFCFRLSVMHISDHWYYIVQPMHPDFTLTFFKWQYPRFIISVQKGLFITKIQRTATRIANKMDMAVCDLVASFRVQLKRKKDKRFPIQLLDSHRYHAVAGLLNLQHSLPIRMEVLPAALSWQNRISSGSHLFSNLRIPFLVETTSCDPPLHAISPTDLFSHINTDIGYSLIEIRKRKDNNPIPFMITFTIFCR